MASTRGDTSLAARLRGNAELGYRVLAAVTLVAIFAGLALHAGGNAAAARAVWAATVVVMLIPLTVSVIRALMHGRLGVDLIALIAMAGALALGEYLAGAVIALMLAGGNALEAAANGRARRALTALLEGAPKVARRRVGDVVEEVPIDALQPGDIALVRGGEVVPVDGLVAAGTAVVDEATLTGESLPVTRAVGEIVRSGAVNAGAPFDVRATRPAAQAMKSGRPSAPRRIRPFTTLGNR